MKSLLHLGFLFVWALIAFAVVRSLLSIWIRDRRVATLCAFAVAGAFFLGSTIPLAWPQLPGGGASIAESFGQPATCLGEDSLDVGHAVGYIDTVKVGSEAVAQRPTSVTVAPGAKVAIVGWAALDNGPGSAICLIVDGRVEPGPATYGIQRPDVAAATKIAADLQAGFRIQTTAIGGTHTIGVGVLEPGRRSVKALANSVVITTR